MTLAKFEVAIMASEEICENDRDCRRFAATELSGYLTPVLTHGATCFRHYVAKDARGYERRIQFISGGQRRSA